MVVTRSGSMEEQHGLKKRSVKRTRSVIIQDSCVEIELAEPVGKQRNSYKLYDVRSGKVPEFLYYDYIFSGYRVNFSWPLCFQSIYRLHNETGNIWTHLAGFWIFVGILWYSWVNIFDDDTVANLMIVIYVLAACVCLGSSAFFHTCCCHSHKAYNVCAQADYTGVLIMIVGSFYPGVYFAFYCQEFYQKLYLYGITVVTGGLIAFSLTETFRRPEFRVGRALLFAMLGGLGLVPIGHYLATHSMFEPLLLVFSTGVLFMCLFYLGGLAFFITQFPESKWPGKFDLWGHSHQYWHLCVFFAQFVYFVSVAYAYSIRHQIACDA
jgi:adiponectin receptor